MNSIVIQTSFLGDMVLTTPLLAALAERGPVDVVATPASARLLDNHPAVHRVLVYDKRGAGRGLGGFRRVVRAMRAARADTAYMAQGSLRSAGLALAAGIRTRVGFATSAGRALYSRRIPYRRDLHHAARLWQLGTPESEPSAMQIQPKLYPGDAERAAVDQLLDGTDDGRPMVALAPGSVWATKRWPFYPDLARELTEHARLVIVGSAADRALAEAILAAAPRALDATGGLSLLASAELVARCNVLVSNDSLPQHLASAVGTPTVTLFGPTVPSFGFGPLAPGSVVLEHLTLDCRPCTTHGLRQCPLVHWKCMRDLGADAVAPRVVQLLSQSGPRT